MASGDDTNSSPTFTKEEHHGALFAQIGDYRVLKPEGMIIPERYINDGKVTNNLFACSTLQNPKRKLIPLQISRGPVVSLICPLPLS